MSADNWDICPRCRERAGIYASEAERTFREDYEFYGADTGTLKISYEGHCSVCDLSLSVAEVRQFWPEEAVGR